MTFSQDEINLMCIYDTSDKTELLKELRFSVPYIRYGIKGNYGNGY